jgi:hypothetical protein
MGKYETVMSDVLSVFGTAEWIAENIKTYPANFVGVDTGNTYIRVSVLPQGEGLNLKSASGQVLIDIFTPAGNGPMAAARIADRLDTYLVGKSKQLNTGVTQLGKSSFALRGVDKANPALHRSQYAISFNYFGV